MKENLITETVEAEITAIKPLQRVRDAENRAGYRKWKRQLSGNPYEKPVVKWTAEGAVKCEKRGIRPHRVFCNVWAYVSCRGYVGILLRARGLPVNARWHRG